MIDFLRWRDNNAFFCEWSFGERRVVPVSYWICVGGMAHSKQLQYCVGLMIRPMIRNFCTKKSHSFLRWYDQEWPVCFKENLKLLIFFAIEFSWLKKSFFLMIFLSYPWAQTKIWNRPYSSFRSKSVLCSSCYDTQCFTLKQFSVCSLANRSQSMRLKIHFLYKNCSI